eukprot:TRINITY_DN5350_c0_g1_i1.p2 TRINITY_DN5350_c0_g1~~TRINITY_DN5350_c0_g1_i1.p2  ORF type:complete len:57 (+),score=13.51 TRINITY_DN5350_c0_g1_i1:207-377(+)
MSLALLLCFLFSVFSFRSSSIDSIIFTSKKKVKYRLPHVLCVDTGRSSETAKAHRG